MLRFLLRLSRTELLSLGAALILAIALVDWRVELNVSFGFLYLFPMLILGSCLAPWTLALLAGLCTILAERFAPFAWDAAAGVPRDIFMLAAYFGTGLFAAESARNRRLAAQHVREVEEEAELRRDAEQQLQALIESSPAAILTVDSGGKILMANQAAHRLLGFEGSTLRGEPIKSFLPPLAAVPPANESTPSFRTALECSGRRRDGEVFLADVWFSTYRTSAGPRLAAMLVDSSDELRDKEESSLHHLMLASRLAVGAVSHEIRNVCGAISVVYENLSRQGHMAGSEDFRALGNLVEGLGKIATLELRQSTRSEDLFPVDLGAVLDELRIVTGPSLRRVRCARPLARAQESAPRLGRAPQSPPGSPQPYQKQSARPGGPGREGVPSERCHRGRSGGGAGSRYRPRHPEPRTPFSTVSGGSRIHRAGALHLARPGENF